MPLMPKRVKFRKSQRGKVKGNACRGNRVNYGEFGLQSIEGGWLSAEAIEAGRITAAKEICDIVRGPVSAEVVSPLGRNSTMPKPRGCRPCGCDRGRKRPSFWPSEPNTARPIIGSRLASSPPVSMSSAQ